MNVLYSGVDFSLPGNGGSECVNYLSWQQRLIETLLFTALSIIEVRISLKFLSKVEVNSRKEFKWNNPLLAASCLVFGIEIGYKLSSMQLLWIFNPCHMVNIMQIILLLLPQSRFSHALFRLHANILNAPTLALLFPVTNTRILPLETFNYYVQHILLPFTAMSLMTVGPYSMEPLPDLSWVWLAMGSMRIYHFWVLQPIALYTQVNLNNILCPAVSDPFAGRWYRIAANTHQTAFMILHSKALVLLSRRLSSNRNHND